MKKFCGLIKNLYLCSANRVVIVVTIQNIIDRHIITGRSPLRSIFGNDYSSVCNRGGLPFFMFNC